MRSSRASARCVPARSLAERKRSSFSVHSYPQMRRPEFSYSIDSARIASLVPRDRRRVLCGALLTRHVLRCCVLSKLSDKTQGAMHGTGSEPRSIFDERCWRGFVALHLAGFWIVHWWFGVAYRGMPATEAFFLQHGLRAWLAWFDISFEVVIAVCLVLGIWRSRCVPLTCTFRRASGNRSRYRAHVPVMLCTT